MGDVGYTVWDIGDAGAWDTGNVGEGGNIRDVGAWDIVGDAEDAEDTGDTGDVRNVDAGDIWDALSIIGSEETKELFTFFGTSIP